MMVLARFPSSIAAHMARMKLGQHGIETIVPDDVLETTYGYDFPAGGARLMIDSADAEQAAAILQSTEEVVVLADEWEAVRNNEIGEAEVSGPSRASQFFDVNGSWLIVWGLFVLLLIGCLKMLVGAK